MRAPKILLIFAVIATGFMLHSAAEAQWSIGAPGPRTAPRGANRYAFFVYANPLPGRETDFNEWYQNVHMGDLISLPGWTGGQRFRLVKDVTPLVTEDIFNKYGYVVEWDQQGNDAETLHAETRTGNTGGKIHRGPGFDYSPGAGYSAYFQVLGPRMTRPDGKKPFVPDENDYKTQRPNRYLVMDYSQPAPGVTDADYEASLARRVNQVLNVPGWMAAQTLRFVPPAGGNPANGMPTRYLIMWETEGTGAQAVHDALADAVKNGAVQAVSAVPATARAIYWQPISPYVTRDDFQR